MFVAKVRSRTYIMLRRTAAMPVFSAASKSWGPLRRWKCLPLPPPLPPPPSEPAGGGLAALRGKGSLAFASIVTPTGVSFFLLESRKFTRCAGFSRSVDAAFLRSPSGKSSFSGKSFTLYPAPLNLLRSHHLHYIGSVAAHVVVRPDEGFLGQVRQQHVVGQKCHGFIGQ